MIERKIKLYCDSSLARDCAYPEPYHDTYNAGTADGIRAAARIDGWTRDGNLDVCPQCAAAQRAKEAPQKCDPNE